MGGCRGRGLRWLLLVLSSGSTVSPSLSRHRERRDQRPSAGGGGATAATGRRGEGPAAETEEDGVCACAAAPQPERRVRRRRRRRLFGPCRAPALPTETAEGCRRRGRRGVGVGSCGRGSESGSARWGWGGRGARARGLGVSALSPHAGTRPSSGRGGAAAGAPAAVRAPRPASPRLRSGQRGFSPQQQHHEFQFPGARRRCRDMSQAFFLRARSPPRLRRTWASPRPAPGATMMPRRREPPGPGRRVRCSRWGLPFVRCRVAAMRSARPSTGSGEPAGRTMQLLHRTVHAPAWAPRATACDRSLPGRRKPPGPGKPTDLNRWSSPPAEVSFRSIVRATDPQI